MISMAEFCSRFNPTSDQLEKMGAKYMRLSMDTMRWGFHFEDGSKGYYNAAFKFTVY